MEFARKIISHSPSEKKWQCAMGRAGLKTAHSPLSFFKGFIAIKAFSVVQRVQIVTRDQTLNSAASDPEHIGCALAVAVILLQRQRQVAALQLAQGRPVACQGPHGVISRGGLFLIYFCNMRR